MFWSSGSNSRKPSTSSSPSSKSGRPASPLSNDPLAVIQDLKSSIHKRTHEITSVSSKYDSAFSLETQTLLHHLQILSQTISNIEVNTLVNLNHKKPKSSSKKVKKDLEQLGEVHRELDVVFQKFSGSIERWRGRMETQQMNELIEKKMEKERVKNEAREQKERKAQAQEAHKLIKSLTNHTSYLSKSINKLTTEIPSRQRRFADPEYTAEVAQILSHVIQLSADFAVLKPTLARVTSTTSRTTGATPSNTIQLQCLSNTLYQLVSRLTNIERFYAAANDAYYHRHSHSSKAEHQRRKEETYKHNIALENDLLRSWNARRGAKHWMRLEPLLKSVPGSGEAIVEYHFPLFGLPRANQGSAPIGAKPPKDYLTGKRFDKIETIYELMLFYNEDFGVKMGDDRATMIGKFFLFLGAEDVDLGLVFGTTR